MDEHPLLVWLIHTVGILLVALGVSDVFMTVLYVRAGTGPLSHRLASALWAVTRRIVKPFSRACKEALLTFFGPGFLVLLTSVWISLVIVGFSLIVWPHLGREVNAQQGPTPRDFFTALYYVGGNMSTMGSGDLRPVSAFFKALSVYMAVLGVSMLTLIVTYIIQVYTALQRRNALALALHHVSGGSGDAAELLARLGANDDFSTATSSLAGLATEITTNYESHHFYSVLIYFRFREPQYAMSRAALIILELVTLIDSALDDARHGWVRRSAAVTQIREGGMHVLTELAGIYLPGGAPEVGGQSGEVKERWRARYRAAVELLRKCGVSVVSDESEGAERYVDLRVQWDSYVMAFAHYLESPAEVVDPMGTRPELTGENREMPVPPLKAAG